MTRKFEDRPAAREKTPIMVGLVGPSGTGKTFSALRLATGFQSVTGGDIFFVDTEARRALHYADRFKFRHLAFGAPFSPLDYLAAIEHCIAKGAKTIVIDSMSHEHEGPGGVLEMHEAEHKRLGGKEGTKMLAWGKPKRERRRLINSILQMEANFVFCWRAKQKIKMERGKDPLPLGWMPIAGEEFVYEMTLKCLLLPGANGIPTWKPEGAGEKEMVKLPEQFRALFANGPQLNEEIGAQLARWSAGGAGTSGAPMPLTFAELVAQYEACSDPASLRSLKDQRSASWSKLSKKEQEAVRLAAESAKTRIDEAERRAMEVPTGPADITDEERQRIEEDERRGYTTNPDEDA